MYKDSLMLRSILLYKCKLERWIINNLGTKSILRKRLLTKTELFQLPMGLEDFFNVHLFVLVINEPFIGERYFTIIG